MRSKKSFVRNHRGVAMIEFALALPILLLLLYGVVEVTRYSYFHQKLSDTASQLVNITNQYVNHSNDTLDVIYGTYDELMEPFGTQNTNMIVTAFRQTYEQSRADADHGIVVNWQAIRGDNTLPSNFAPDGNNSYDLNIFNAIPRKGDQLILVEINAEYRPLVGKGLFDFVGLENINVYKFAFAKPRFGAFDFDPNLR